MGQIFAICDTDRLYVKNLMQYISSRQSVPLRLQAFTDPELLKAFARVNNVGLLLISLEAMDEEIAELPIGRIVLLTEDGAIDLKGMPSVNRYQASANLVREVMEHYSTDNLAAAYTAVKLASVQLIGVYSPIRRCGKTALALALGEAYARERRVLYVNLEEYSGFRALMEREYRLDISDLLYFYREEKQGMLKRVEEAAEKQGNLYYLPPAVCPTDLRALSPEEWREWFQLLQQSSFETIIVEPGECINGLEDILSMCHKIYMPTLGDRVSEAKLKDYESCLLLSGWESLKGRIQRQVMPQLSGAAGWGLKEYKEAEEVKRIAEQLIRENGHG